MELRYGPDSYGRQQWGILGNGRKPDPATPREGRRSSDCKPLSTGTKQMTVPYEEATANYVPAAAVIRRWRALSGFTGYLILFAPHAFVSQRQLSSSNPPSPLVFLLISTHFTATLGIPITSPTLKKSSFKCNSMVKPLHFTSDLPSRLLTLYTQ